MKNPFAVLIILLPMVALLAAGIGLTACGGTPPTEQPDLPPVDSTDQPTAAPTTVPEASADERAGYVPLFEPGECVFKVPELYEAACGHLVVPEDRSQPEGGDVRLPVAIFKSKSPNPAPDPVIHLVGGPGGNLLDQSEFYLNAGGARILQARDYVLFNQRGTHHTQPSLECPGQKEFRREIGQQELNREEREAREIEFLLTCQTGLLEQGIDMSAYNSAEIAADIEDLRLALGYDQVNLYGISYGTRLALTAMRDHPQGIRSVIIDSIYPPQVDLDQELALNADRAFNTLFEGCAADRLCSSQYPELDRVFFQVVDELNAQPATVAVYQGTAMAWLDGDVFMDAIFGSLYRVDAIPWIPLMIYHASQGDYQPLQTPLEVMLDDSGISHGMHHSVQCREEAAFESHERALALSADLPAQVVEHFASPFAFTLCRSWQAGKADPIENEPVVSDIPTLVLAGQYDPITPPAWGRLTAETLSNSFFYEFPGIGHGVMRSSECGLEIGLQFLDDPAAEPDASCLDELEGPDFK
jgi:pimeloyl-ACP methyl ester carboxylesterase